MILEDEADLFQPQPAQVRAQPAAVVDELAFEPSCPDDGSRMQPTMLSTVVLPEPLGPRRPTTSPAKDAQRHAAQRIDARRSFAEVLADVDELDQDFGGSRA